MKIVKCKNCGTEIAEKASICPSCGVKNKKPFYKRPWFIILIIIVALLIFVGIIGGGEDSSSNYSESNGIVNTEKNNENKIDQYKVTIDNCTLIEDYKGKSVAIVDFTFTNNSGSPAAFNISFIDHAFQNGIEAEHCYFLGLNDSYKFYEDDNNQSKEIKTGTSINVKVAYYLNDTTSPLEVEVEGFLSWSNDKVVKTFSMN